MTKLIHVIQIYSIVALATLSQRVCCFVPIAQNSYSHLNQKNAHECLQSFRKLDTKLDLSFTQDQQLEFWITTFSSAHIGMSAVRDKLIDGCGELATKANLIDRGMKLPSYWPGDDFGKNDIFPDANTAGRQIYRILYTIVSFTTLGGALGSYLHSSSDEMRVMVLPEQNYMFLYGIAALSFAASIASLFNASPMSLMPSFEKVGNNDVTNSLGSSGSIAGLQRNDSLKMKPKGLTRVTRHPLILPVVPWGLATSYLAGGRTSDFVLFGGLALYAISGCACQDLRIIRKEGSVGTVMSTTTGEVGTLLESFYQKTSFIPFAAVVDGRQSFDSVVKEFPIIPFIVGIPIGYVMEGFLLQLLVG